MNIEVEIRVEYLTPKQRLRIYRRLWMRKYRAKKRKEYLESHGHCPFCTMLIDSEYHKQFPCESYLAYIHEKMDKKLT